MTIFRRILLRSTPTRRPLPAIPQTLNPPRACSRDLPNPRLLCHLSFEHSNAPGIEAVKFVRGRGGAGRRCLVYPAVLAGLIGLGGLEVAYADAEEGASKQGLPADANNVEEVANKQRQDIDDVLKRKGIRGGSIPNFTVSVRVQKITIKFQIPPACEASQLIANIASNLGLKVEEHDGGSDVSLRAWDSGVAWQLMLKHPEKQKETEGDQEELKDVNKHDRDLHILIFRSVTSTEKTESLQQNEEGGKIAHKSSSIDKLITILKSMGVRVYGVHEPNESSATKAVSWDNLAGYDLQKRQIEDTILLALLSPETYDYIARGTRCKFESNRPRAVLFEGPPGTGKTSFARVIANQAPFIGQGEAYIVIEDLSMSMCKMIGIPLLYVPLEVILSKYYGESERLLGKVFSFANQLPDGASYIFVATFELCILVDSFAISRDGDLHEATRRVLSVLLRQVDGFEQDKKVVVISATNRKEDLDPALISRFDSIIPFGLPDHQTCKEIAGAQYAKQLTESESDELATVTEEMSGRDIRDVCQQAERSWASKFIREQQVSKDGEQIRVPPLQEYIASSMNRRKGLHSSPPRQTQDDI